jgi:hypothetical protein
MSHPAGLSIRDQFPAPLASVADDVIRARTAAERAGVKAQQQTIEAVRALADLGLSRRDAAELLGLSHQRVHQFLEAGWQRRAADEHASDDLREASSPGMTSGWRQLPFAGSDSRMQACRTCW